MHSWRCAHHGSSSRTLRPAGHRRRLAVLATVSAIAAGCLAGASGAQAAPPSTDQTHVWQQAFGDDFNGTVLDATKWVTCYWWDYYGCTHGSDELQWYLPANVIVSDGTAKLRAQQQTILGSDGKAYDYTSGMISTGSDTNLSTPPRFQYQYGYMEIRAKVPSGNGLWPAFWSLPTDQSWPPEIDAMEILGGSPSTNHMSLHYRDSSGALGTAGSDFTGPDFSSDWHTFGVDWEPDAVVWYLDGVELFRYTNAENIPNKPMYLLANLAVGGWAGSPDASTVFPSDYQIDYVRVWQRQADTTPPSVTITSPANGAKVRRGSTITLAASATDNVAVSKVEFYVNGSLLCTRPSAPYSCSWKAPSGAKRTYQIVAKAYDPAGNTSTSSVSLSTL